LANVIENVVNHTNLSNLSTSYLLHNLLGVSFEENHSLMGAGTNHQKTGFGISTSSLCSFYNNNLITASPFSIGFSTLGSASNEFECNYTTGNFRRGFRFTNPCLNTDFRTNVMTNNVQALRLENATISNQPYKGNIFIGAASKAELANQSPLDNNQFTFNNNNSMPITNGMWRPVTVVPTNDWWFNEFDNDNLTCSDPLGEPQPLISELEDIATGDIAVNDYYDQNLWTSRLQLLRLLDNDPSLMGNNTVLTNFYNNSSTVKSYYNFENDINELYYATAQEKNDLTSYYNFLSTKNSELDNILALIDDNNFTFYLAAIESKMDEINTVKGQIDAVNTTISQRGLSAAANLKSNLSSLASPYGFCDDFKDVFLAKLDLEIEGETYVLSNYSSTLSNLAEQCVYEVGNPVLIARGLCDALNISYIEDDEEACSENRMVNITTDEISNTFTVYPNPVDKILRIDNTDNLENINVRDINGKDVSQYLSSIKNEDNISINVSRLISGIYFISATDSISGKTMVSKFIKL
jgi:hypothetical protein